MNSTAWTGANDVLAFVRQHKSKNNVEIEFRLGKKNGNVFDTNVGKKKYHDALHSLKQYKNWESIKERHQVLYYGLRKGLRIVYDEDTDEQECVTKHRAAHIDQILNGWSMDIRTSACIEIPSTYDPEKDSFPNVKKRNRTSFIRKGLSIDVSEIIGSSADKDQENNIEYQIEFEIIDPGSLVDDNQVFNHYHKIFDLLKCLK
jgi:hypothetical protein